MEARIRKAIEAGHRWQEKRDVKFIEVHWHRTALLNFMAVTELLQKGAQQFADAMNRWAQSEQGQAFVRAAQAAQAAQKDNE